MSRVWCGILVLLFFAWALPAIAAPPQKAVGSKVKTGQKAKAGARSSLPVYDVAKLKAGCAKLGNAAKWNEQTSRCELVSTKPDPRPFWVALGVIGGGLVVGASVAAIVILSSSDSQKLVSPSSGSQLWK